jgi:hypothetical protein
MNTFSSLSTVYAKYSNSTTKLNNFYHSKQTYKYSVISRVWDNLLIESAFKHRICKLLHELESVVYIFWTGIWIHSIETTPNYAIFFLGVLLKTVIVKDWEHAFIEPDLKHRISK